MKTPLAQIQQILNSTHAHMCVCVCVCACVSPNACHYLTYAHERRYRQGTFCHGGVQSQALAADRTTGSEGWVCVIRLAAKSAACSITLSGLLHKARIFLFPIGHLVTIAPIIWSNT